MPKTISFDTVQRDGANVWISPDGSVEVELVYHLEESATGQRGPQQTRRFTAELGGALDVMQLPPQPSYADAIKLLASALTALVAQEEGV